MPLLSGQRLGDSHHLSPQGEQERTRILLDKATVAYFKALAEELGMPYQNLINLYLRDCALSCKTLKLKWAS
jgi:hypothetical protein